MKTRTLVIGLMAGAVLTACAQVPSNTSPPAAAAPAQIGGGDDLRRGPEPIADPSRVRIGTYDPEGEAPEITEIRRQALHEAAGQKGAAVGACSALRKSYRDYMVEKAGEPILFVYLKGDRAVIAERMAQRHHEYMPQSLLDSQFVTDHLARFGAERITRDSYHAMLDAAIAAKAEFDARPADAQPELVLQLCSQTSNRG
jgi:carbohydrate kinase (thermoresistant glucokinase family)